MKNKSKNCADRYKLDRELNLESDYFISCAESDII